MKCPKCGSVNYQKIGFIPGINGPKQRYRCSDCGKTFYNPEEAKKP